MRNMPFVAQGILWGFVLCPGLAWLLTKIIPFDPAYAAGLLLLGMTPCAPFLPLMAEKARADMGATAALMLLSLFITMLYMPIAVPFMASGLPVSPWAIAKPILLFMLLP